MIYTTKKIKDLSIHMNELINRYSDYYKVKENLDLDTVNTKIWSKGYIEPFSSDFITDLFDNTVTPRKVMKSTKKKEYVTLNYMNDNVPVYSVYYGRDDEIYMEKLYINSLESHIELLFDIKKHFLLSIAMTLFDSHLRPIEYCRLDIESNKVKKIISAIYI